MSNSATRLDVLTLVDVEPDVDDELDVALELARHAVACRAGVSRDPPSARARRRLASEPTLRPRAREAREGALPELQVIPRTKPELVDAFLEAGAEGAVVSLADESAARELAARYR